MAFSKAQTATFTAPGDDGTLFTDVQIETDWPLTNTTAALAMTATEYCAGLAQVDISGLQANCAALGRAQVSIFQFAVDPLFKQADFTISRSWGLVNVTGTTGSAADTAQQWQPRLGDIFGNVRGWATGATSHLYVGGTLTITLSTLGTVVITDAAPVTCRVRHMRIGVPKAVGGPVPVQVFFLMSGNTTTSTYVEFDTVTTTAPPEGTMTVVNSGGPAFSGNVINHGITISNQYTSGGSVTVRRQFRGSLAVA